MESPVSPVPQPCLQSTEHDVQITSHLSRPSTVEYNDDEEMSQPSAPAHLSQQPTVADDDSDREIPQAALHLSQRPMVEDDDSDYEMLRAPSRLSRRPTVEDDDSDDEMPRVPSHVSRRPPVDDFSPLIPLSDLHHARVEDKDDTDNEADTEIDDITEISPPKPTYADRTRDINHFFSSSFMKDNKSVRECRRCS